MCIPRLTPFVRDQVTATSTTGVRVLTTPWMLAYGTDTLRVVSELQSNTGNLQSKVRLRFADSDTTKPEDWDATLVGTQLTGEGFQVDNFDTSSHTEAWVQAGLEVSSSSGVSSALSMLRMSAAGAGQIIAAKTIEITQESSNTGYLPLSEPLPLIGLSGLSLIGAFEPGAGTVTCQPVYREIQDDVTTGGTWSTLGSSASFSTSIVRKNWGALSFTPTAGQTYWQPGLTIASGTGSGVLHVMVFVKY